MQRKKNKENLTHIRQHDSVITTSETKKNRKEVSSLDDYNTMYSALLCKVEEQLKCTRLSNVARRRNGEMYIEFRRNTCKYFS